MKIDDSKKAAGSSVNATTARSGKSAEKAGVAQSSQSAKPATDNVHLSQAQQLVAQVAGTNNVFEAKKVEDIKAAIAAGTFTVDAEKVADGLLDTVNNLIHSRKA